MKKRDPEIKFWPISKVNPCPSNPRKISDKAITAVAGSIKAFGFRNPIIVDKSGEIVNGHTRRLAALSLGMKSVPVMIADDLTPEQIRAFRLADNRVAEFSEWDRDMLVAELGQPMVDVEFASFDDLLRELPKSGFASEPRERDPIPETADGPAISKRGEVYNLGSHRLMCGDSTNAADVAALMGEDIAPLLHADPPYGMGKEAEGVENDNLYNNKLDAFQMSWWKTWRKYLRDNGSAYIWGTAPDLFRLWYSGGLRDSENISIRNEIVWNKKTARGQSSDEMRSYAPSTERCLFLMLGRQEYGLTNSDSFHEPYEPIRAYLEEQVKVMTWKNKEITDICGVEMFSRWFTRSQWQMITVKHYAALQVAAKGHAFTRSYTDLRTEYEKAAQGFIEKRDAFYGTRPYFDNAHDTMTDVWEFPIVTTEDRYGHPTPKPVAMIARAIKSSAPAGEIVMEPFGGSGSTLIAAAMCSRLARVMEISEAYCDVIRRRWHSFAIANQLEVGADALGAEHG